MSGFEPVGLAGFEPTTPCPPDKCANKLRYSPLQALSLLGFSCSRLNPKQKQNNESPSRQEDKRSEAFWT